MEDTIQVGDTVSFRVGGFLMNGKVTEVYRSPHYGVEAYEVKDDMGAPWRVAKDSVFFEHE
jgi:hypothetical protein